MLRMPLLNVRSLLNSTRNKGTDRGSLFHIRNTSGYRNVTKDVTKSFNYNADLLEFTKQGLTVLLANKLHVEINQIPEKPDLIKIIGNFFICVGFYSGCSFHSTHF